MSRSVALVVLPRMPADHRLALLAGALLSSACATSAVVLDRPDASDAGRASDGGPDAAGAELDVAWDVEVPSPDGRVGSLAAASNGAGGVIVVGDRARTLPLWAQRVAGDGSLVWAAPRDALAADGADAALALVAHGDRAVLLAPGRLQRIDTDGMLAWGEAGIAIAPRARAELAGGGADGVWIVGTEASTPAVLAAERRAISDGSVSARAILTTDELGLAAVAVASDGEDGVYVAWQRDELSASVVSVARVAPAGLAWSTVLDVRAAVLDLGVVADASGCWVWWVEGAGALRAQRVGAAGTAAGAIDVAPVHDAPAIGAASDGAGGAALVFRAPREAGADTEATRWAALRADGTAGDATTLLAPELWGRALAPIRLSSGAYILPIARGERLYAQRLDASGAPRLPDVGVEVGEGSLVASVELGPESVALVYAYLGAVRVARLDLAEGP